MTTKQQTEQDEAREHLRKMLKPGDTVYTVLRHCSRSGMYRAIDLFVIRKNEHLRLSWQAAKAIGFKYDKRHEAIGVGGCGMDMGFHIVHSLGYALFGKEAREGTGRKATALRRALFKADSFYFTQGGTPAPDATKPGDVWFGGAGYALKQRWI